jgi:hypothetical protein
VLFTIEPKDLRRARRMIASVGEDEFRRAVHEMTKFDTDALSLDDVICVYVLALEGRVQPPGAGRRAVELYPTLPPPTADDPCRKVGSPAPPVFFPERENDLGLDPSATRREQS